VGRTTRMSSGNTLKLGLFAPNCDGGMAITNVPERWKATWENNLALARLADEAGLEFLLPVARWIGFGGNSEFQRQSLETLTWAEGVLAHTRDLMAFGTIHAPMIHPIVAAKQIATIDHVSAGRFGVNVVCGWNDPEFKMFGMTQRAHDDRYGYGQEWLDVIRTIWRSEDPVDFEGSFFKLPGLIGRPGPFGGTEPALMNAGFSPAGRDFAQRNCEFLVTSFVDHERGRADVLEITARARSEYGRDVGVFAVAYIVCRPTRAEAQEYHHHYANEQADWDATDRLIELQGLHAQSFPPGFDFQAFRQRFSGGHGGYPIIGDPDDVADELTRISATGFSGLAFTLVDYLGELPYLRDEVLPRLVARGLRSAPGAA
jgi:FMNH2-dependent dimethyl sulfone monooxygenase